MARGTSKADVTEADGGRRGQTPSYPGALQTALFERRLHMTVSAGTVLVFVHVLRVLHIRALNECMNE